MRCLPRYICDMYLLASPHANLRVQYRVILFGTSINYPVLHHIYIGHSGTVTGCASTELVVCIFWKCCKMCLHLPFPHCVPSSPPRLKHFRCWFDSHGVGLFVCLESCGRCRFFVLCVLPFTVWLLFNVSATWFSPVVSLGSEHTTILHVTLRMWYSVLLCDLSVHRIFHWA